jgi:hypothetical protein
MLIQTPGRQKASKDKGGGFAILFIFIIRLSFGKFGS